jgi:hypothetical protein
MREAISASVAGRMAAIGAQPETLPRDSLHAITRWCAASTLSTSSLSPTANDSSLLSGALRARTAM